MILPASIQFCYYKFSQKILIIQCGLESMYKVRDCMVERSTLGLFN